ncbi:MAG: sigma-54 dependent transcriptional regulator [Gemmatimonadota bacterium]|nr:sigma-54 dependent transcriptional regulator [Gemmatimonadota bacterium]
MNGKFGHILVVDDDDDVLLAARMFLKRHVALVHTEVDPEKIPTLMKNEDYNVILLDMNFTRDASSGQEGFFWLNRILEIDPSAVVVLITAYGDVEMAVRAIKEGAMDFVLKPWQNEKLLATVSAAINLNRSKQEVVTLRSLEKQLSADLGAQFQGFIGESPAMEQIKTTIQKVGPTDADVLILGENGTGKELVARAIHRHSSRKEKPFVSVDMGAITENLFESEMFGHVKGGFTDAKADRAGRFEIASGSTLFLDEIGNLSQPNQAKLLTTLQNREVTRVGSNISKRVDIRLVCATNMPIQDMIQQKTFRADLLYRINTVEIHLPSLEERPEDIPSLIDHFLKVYARKYNKPPMRIHKETIKKLEAYSWPGNVRELQHALERALIMSDGPILQPSDFFLSMSENISDREEGVAFDSYNLDEVDKTVIRKVLSNHQGNVSKAARELGLTRTSLYRRMEKYGL